jgi:hypothetical protein
MTYELWDGEMGVRLGSYVTEHDALLAVRALLEQGHGSSAPLGLIVHGRALVASGDELARRAQGAALADGHSPRRT